MPGHSELVPSCDSASHCCSSQMESSGRLRNQEDQEDGFERSRSPFEVEEAGDEILRISPLEVEEARKLTIKSIPRRNYYLSCCCCCCSFIIVAYLGASLYAAKMFVTLHKLTRIVKDEQGRTYTPENITQHPLCMRSHIEIGDCASEKLLSEFSEYSRTHPWKLVSFMSRPGDKDQDQVKLVAWWLPAPLENASRIILTHGYKRNFDVHYVQIVGYFLRTLGYSVLAPSLRDHGLSHKSKKPHVTWGYAYPFDVLGAWDYAVNDPDGKLGGAMKPDKVGLLGFSMGGFVSAVAFGMEPRVPGVWLDSPAYDIQPNLAVGISKILPGMGNLIAPTAFIFSKMLAGADLALHTPKRWLAWRKGQKRKSPIAVTASPRDSTVPFEQAKLFFDSSDKDDEPLMEMYRPYVCGRSTHCNKYLWKPNNYRSNLCKFWSKVFTGKESDCGIDKLPRFPECNAVECRSPVMAAAYAEI